jgi:hypothetical protein
MLSLNDYITQLQQAQAEANAANEKRLKEVTGLYDEIIKQYSTGGSAEKAGLNQIGEAKKSSVSSGTQALVNSGFANSDMMANLGNQFEKDVGATARLTLESTLQDKLSAAKTGKAGMIERVQDEGPDDSLIAQLLMQASQGGTTTRIVRNSGGTGVNWQTIGKEPAKIIQPASTGMNNQYWNNGQWRGASAQPQAVQAPAQAATPENEFQALVNKNMKQPSKTAQAKPKSSGNTVVDFLNNNKQWYM